MTASYGYVIDTGTVTYDTSTLLADVEAEWIAALGANLDTDGSTPQGTLIAAEVLARTKTMKNNADLANVFNPALSYGVFLDAICALLGITRGTNRSTVGTGVVMALNVGTTVTAGSRVQTSNGDIFTLVADVPANSDGSNTTGDFQSSAYGSIPLPLGALEILDGTTGWGSATVTSGTTVVEGTTAINDGPLKNKRLQQLAIQGTGSSAAIQARVLDVDNVTSVNVIENNTGVAGVVNGVTFTLPSAMWVCVAGTPDMDEVAAAAYAAHQGGCPWDFGASGMGTPVGSPNGVAVVDPSTGFSYYVKLTTPIALDCYVNITVRQNGSTATPDVAIQNALISYANGQEDGELGLVVGASVSAFEMAGAVARQLPGMYIRSCSVACVPHGSPAPTYPSGYSQEVVLLPYQQATLLISQITVNLE